MEKIKDKIEEFTYTSYFPDEEDKKNGAEVDGTIYTNKRYRCTSCKSPVKLSMNYCCNCGQKLK